MGTACCDAAFFRAGSPCLPRLDAVWGAAFAMTFSGGESAPSRADGPACFPTAWTAGFSIPITTVLSSRPVGAAGFFPVRGADASSGDGLPVVFPAVFRCGCFVGMAMLFGRKREAGAFGVCCPFGNPCRRVFRSRHVERRTRGEDVMSRNGRAAPGFLVLPSADRRIKKCAAVKKSG